jgi:hypothetical protein
MRRHLFHLLVDAGLSHLIVRFRQLGLADWYRGWNSRDSA